MRRCARSERTLSRKNGPVTVSAVVEARFGGKATAFGLLCRRFKQGRGPTLYFITNNKLP